MDVRLQDGTVIQNVPDGITQSQLMAKVNKLQPQSFGKELVRPLARAARSGLSGIASVGDIGGAAVEPIRLGMRSLLESAGVDFMGQNTKFIPPSQGVKNVFDDLTGGIAKPRSGAERVVDVASEAVSGAGIFSAAQKGSQLATKGAQEIIRKLAPQTGAELASAAGAGAGAEIATQIAPNNPLAPVIGAMAGGVATVKGVKAIRNSGDIALLEKSYFNRAAQRNPAENAKFFTNQASNILKKNIKADPRKLESIKQVLKDDKNLVLSDLAGDEARALTRQVGKFREGVRTDIEKFFVTRDRNAATRIIKAVNSNVSGVDKYYNNIDELTSIRSQLGNDMYEEAFKAHPTLKLTPSLNKFVLDGRFQNAIAEARKEGLININEPVNSLRTMHVVYRTLRDTAQSSIKSGKGNMGDSLNQMSRAFVKRIDKVAPKYKKARNTFAGFSDLLDAQEKGLKYTTQKPEQISKLLKGMTAGEKDAYKIGVRESLETEIFKTAKSADEANKIFGKAFNRQQLRSILGDQFGEFSQKMRKEIRMKETQFKVLGGSRTDFNLVEGDEFIQKTAQIAKDGKTAIVAETINVLADTIKNKYLGINDNNAKILAKSLTNNKGGIEAIDRLIARAKSPSRRIQLKQFKNDFGYLAIPAGQSAN
jgi:hypothetical protein